MTQGKNIRLLAVDMDGTCLNSRSQMTAETIRALEAAAKAGIIVVPTTGRSLSCLPHRLAGRQNIYRYVISSNGASVADCREKKEWMQTLIPKEQALRLVRACSGKYDKKKSEVLLTSGMNIMWKDGCCRFLGAWFLERMPRSSEL